MVKASDVQTNRLKELFQRSGISAVEFLRRLGQDVIRTPDGKICFIQDADEAVGISETEYFACGTGCNQWLDDPIFKL